MLSFVFCFSFISYVVSTPAIKSIEDTRIVGGEDVNITDVPYQVSLMKAKRHICGGAIVDRDIIVTAAHCVRNAPAQIYEVRVGSSYTFGGGQLYQVSDLIWHPDIDSNKLDADIAILKLSKPLVYNKGVARIEMADENQEIKDGELTVVTGWGATSEDDNFDPLRKLQRVEVPKVNDKVCSDKFKFRFTITPRMLCAGTRRGGKDACQGDSGGPLVYRNKLSGVVSWGIGCGRPRYPGVYARISALRNWLDVNIAKIRSKHASYANRSV